MSQQPNPTKEKQMKTKQATKPLNSTQIKLLLGEMVRIYNAKVNKCNNAIERMREDQTTRYRDALTVMFRHGGFTEPQVKRLLWHCDSDDTKLGVKEILGEKDYEFHREYNEKRWDCNSHPLHALLQKTKLRLHMSAVGDYEAYLKEFTAEAENLLK
jgi:hypothetical protein